MPKRIGSWRHIEAVLKAQIEGLYQSSGGGSKRDGRPVNHSYTETQQSLQPHSSLMPMHLLGPSSRSEPPACRMDHNITIVDPCRIHFRFVEYRCPLPPCQSPGLLSEPVPAPSGSPGSAWRQWTTNDELAAMPAHCTLIKSTERERMNTPLGRWWRTGRWHGLPA